MLESLGQTNIGNLNLEEPRVKQLRTFNPELDVTDEDWRIGLNALGLLRQAKMWDMAVALAYNMKMLFPNRSNELMIDEKDWQGFRPTYENYKHPNNTFDPTDQWFSKTKSLFPQHFAKTFKDSDFQAVSSVREHYRQSKFYNYYTLLSSDMKIAFPEREITPDLDVRSWVNFKNLYQGRKLNSTSMKMAAVLRILFPEKANELEITQDIWDSGRNFYQEKMHNPFGPLNEVVIANAIDTAVTLTILAAEELKFTDSGLELVRHKPEVELNPDIPSLPEVRKF